MCEIALDALLGEVSEDAGLAHAVETLIGMVRNTHCRGVS